MSVVCPCCGETIPTENPQYREKSHRLMCGDSTDKATVERLGGQAEMSFIDPPYNALKSWGKDEAKSETRLDPARWFANDNMEWPAYKTFLHSAFKGLMGHSVYICCDYRVYPLIVEAIQAVGYELKHCIVWKKNVWGLGWRYRFQHEFIVYACRGEAPFYGDRAQSDVWEIAHENAVEHNTPKPIALVAKAVANSSKRAGIVLDLFLGSGTTAIAAEQLGRLCYGVEIAPSYVAVTLQRLAEMGLSPRLSDD